MSTATVDFTMPRMIDVERLEVLKTGRQPKTGRPWTLYRVWASENGIPIPEELRSFCRLEGSVEITAQAFVKDGAVTHYTLEPSERAKAQYRERRAAESYAEPDEQ